MTRALREYSTVLLALVLLVAVAGCGTQAGASSTSTDHSDSVTIDITLKNGTVKPSGSQVKVKAGSPVHLHIVSDAPGELHVHSSPEQHIEFGKGTTQKTLTIKQPGVVDIEDHALDKLIVQLEVS
jgi:hypothetical protein